MFLCPSPSPSSLSKSMSSNEDLKKKKKSALAGVAQWTERWPVKQRVAGLIPSQGPCLVCGPGPQ